MLIAIGLGLLGLLLIYSEFFAPGAILGVLGGCLATAGLILFIYQDYSIWWILTYVIGIVLLLILVIRLALWKIRSSKGENTLYSGSDQEGFVASSYDKELIEQNGEALTDIKPSGHILINNVPYQAVAESGYIRKGTKIKVIKGEGARLIVRKEDL